jgi:hypothetical protein
VQLVPVDDDAVRLTPPPPLEPLADIAGAVAEALRYPLSGAPLSGRVTRGGRVTIVVEPPTLPVPGATRDPRQDALAAVLDELARLGMERDRHTVLVAGGLGRRAGRAQLERLLQPGEAHDYRGEIVVHDSTGDSLRSVGEVAGIPLALNPALLETDLVVTVTASETTDRGGAGALLAACSAEVVRHPRPAATLLQPSGSPGWELAAAVEAAIGERAPTVGVSLVLDHPRLSGRYRGYPWSEAAVEAAARSPLRPLLNLLPSGIRRAALQSVARELQPVAVLAGPPSVAHAEGLLRGIALRGAGLEEPLDTIVVPLSWTGVNQPREPLNPITAAALALGHALRLWRDAPPLNAGGTVILLHDFSRMFGHGPQAPYRALFQQLRENRDPEQVAEAERAAAFDERAIAAYRDGRAPHPLLPFADWASCEPVLSRAGCVIVAGCRDAGAARALGFVPSHNIQTALQMAAGIAGERHRLGVLLAPPYTPLLAAPAPEGPGHSMPR